MATILVVEDEAKLRELVRRYLEREHHKVITAARASDAKTAIERGGVDLVLLDLNLPDSPGEDLATAFAGQVPIMMLTAKSSEAERVNGLELGVDDYLAKPFSPRELVLRVHAILRRSTVTRQTASILSFGGGSLRIDTERHRVSVADIAVELTPTEWGLLLAFAGAPGKVFSRRELVLRVRGFEFDGYERTVDSHIKNLRRKLAELLADREVIETVVGLGYRFALRHDPS